LSNGEHGRGRAGFSTPNSYADRTDKLSDVVHVEGPALLVEQHEDERDLAIQLDFEQPDSGKATAVPSDDSKPSDPPKNSKI
jgi:hypothetical protein